MSFEYERPWLADYQREALFGAERYGIVEGSTKCGKTAPCLIWLAEQCMFGGEGQNHWWVAPVYPQAEIAYKRMKRGLPREIIKTHDTDKWIELPGSRRMWFKSAEKPDNLYGEDVYSAVIDEASRCREESWYAVRSTLTATRGRVRIIGNVKGRRNWAFAIARKAEAGAEGMSYKRITAHDAVQAGILSQAEIEQARADLPEAVFRELYLAEPSDDGGNPFGMKAIVECVGSLSSGKPVAWGWDLAKSVDWTVGIALDAEGRVCRFERFQKPWDATMDFIADATGSVPALVDSTGVGDPILEMLQKRSGSRFEGFKFTSESKQRIMEGLAVAIQKQEIAYPDGPIRAELENFEYEYTRTGVRYCMDADTPVLTADLRYVPVGSLSAGDKLLAFDEEPRDGAKVRKWRSATVTDIGSVVRPCYRMRLEDGTEFVCSAEHLWLVASNNGPMEWKRTSELRGEHEWSKSPRFAPHRLIRVAGMWQENRSYEAGYLAAAFDGEGSLSQQYRVGRDGSVLRLAFAQRDNPMAAEVRDYLKRLGFQHAEGGNGGTNRDVVNFGLVGRAAETLRFLGEVRPKRLLAKFDPDRIGSLWSGDQVKIVSVESLGDREVIAMGTTTKTFVAAGFATHNCAPDGFHDDCVCSLALAVSHKAHARQPLTIDPELRRLAKMPRRGGFTFNLGT